MAKVFRKISFTGIILAVLSFILIFPFIWAFFNSFKDNTEILTGVTLLPQKWVVENYSDAWNDGHFDRYMINSTLLAVITLIMRVVLTVPAGYAFAKMEIRKYPAVFYLFLIGMAIPAQAMVIPSFYQMKDMRLLDSVIGVALPLVSFGIPFSIFMMRNFFRDIPDSILESGKIDGASHFRILWSLMIPMAKPGIMVVAVFSFMDGWNEYLFSILMLISDACKTIPLGVVKFFGTVYYNSRYGAVFASVVIAFIPSIIIYILLQRSFIDGIVDGSEKG